jgi:hypothetical protein
MSQMVRQQSDQKKRLQWEDVLHAINTPVGQKAIKSEDPELFLSLRNLDYINPDGLVWLLLLSDYLNEKGKMIWLELPNDRWQLDYLKNSYFIDVAQENFSITNLYKLDSSIIGTKTKKGSNDYLRFWKVDISSVNQLSLVNLHKTIAKVLNIYVLDELDFNVVQPFVNLIIETSRNLVQHSRGRNGDGWGYLVLAQKPFKGVKRLTCMIGDNGIGFKKSLTDKGVHVRGDQEAINKALLFRYHNREGAGLFRSVQFASRLHGVVRIRTGKASSFLNFTNQYLDDEDNVQSFINKNMVRRDEKIFFPGVQIYIEATGWS